MVIHIKCFQPDNDGERMAANPGGKEETGIGGNFTEAPGSEGKFFELAGLSSEVAEGKE